MTDASRRAVLLGARIRLVCSRLVPCAAGASVISVRHRIFEQDHLVASVRERILPKGGEMAHFGVMF